MIKKKICMLGAFSVGKTSLAMRYAHSLYSPRYLTTVGVEIHRRTVRIDDREVGLLIWDLAGEDDLHQVRTCHLRGAAGYLLVIDGTRPATAEVALDLQRRVEVLDRAVPFVVVLNKVDRRSEWAIDNAIREIQARGWDIRETSARTGMGVEEAFAALARETLEQPVA